MVDEEIAVRHLELVNQYLDELQTMRGLDREAYLDDVVHRRAVERSLMNVIQACIDLASHVRASEDLGPADASREEFEALGEAGIVAEETASKLAEAAGLRNFLAHRYGEVDHDIVYDVLHEELEWFERFQREVATWLREQVE